MFLLRLSGVSGAVEGGVDQQTHDGDHLGRGEHEVPAGGCSQVAGGCGVGGVVASGGPLGAGDVETVVVVHSQDVLHGQDVAVGSEAQVLPDNTDVQKEAAKIQELEPAPAEPVVVNENPVE